eukprot:6176117-Pleurochrysis_carterae.AAC.2
MDDSMSTIHAMHGIPVHTISNSLCDEPMTTIEIHLKSVLQKQAAHWVTADISLRKTQSANSSLGTLRLQSTTRSSR